MKMIFKTEEEFKKHILGRIKEMTDAGQDQAAATAAVKDYLSKNEFCNEAGHTLTMSLETADDADPTDGPDMKALIKGVVGAVKEGFKGIKIESPGLGGNVEVTEDWERLLTDKETSRNYGFKNLGEQAMAIYRATVPGHNKQLDPRLELLSKGHKAIQKRLATDRAVNKATPTTYSSELVGADGGFLVAPEFREEIQIIIEQKESILSMTDMTPTSSNVVNLTVDQNTPWDNSTGIQTFFRAQAATMTQSKVILQNRMIPLNELYSLVPVTDELLDDSPRLNNYLSVKAPAKMGYRIDEAIFRGKGQVEPLGFFNGPGTVTVTSASANKTFTLLDLSNMLSQLYQTNMQGTEGCWIMTPRAFAYLINLSIGSATGYPVGIQYQNIQNRMIPTILGMPIYVSQHASAWSSAGDVILCNMKGYMAFTKRDGIDFASSIHLFFDSGATAFRWRFRVGGEPALKTTITPAQDTTNPMSHFVLLGAR